MGDCFVPPSLWYYCERAGLGVAVSVDCSRSVEQCCSERDLLVVEAADDLVEAEGG